MWFKHCYLVNIYIQMIGPNCHFNNLLIESAKKRWKKYDNFMQLWWLLTRFIRTIAQARAYAHTHKFSVNTTQWKLTHLWINLLFIAPSVPFHGHSSAWSMKCITIMQIRFICMEIFNFLSLFFFYTRTHMSLCVFAHEISLKSNTFSDRCSDQRR